VTPHRADVEQDGSILRACLFERGGSPRPPGDGLMCRQLIARGLGKRSLWLGRIHRPYRLAYVPEGHDAMRWFGAVILILFFAIAFLIGWTLVKILIAIASFTF
jgi:hypothetical protein